MHTCTPKIWGPYVTLTMKKNGSVDGETECYWDMEEAILEPGQGLRSWRREGREGEAGTQSHILFYLMTIKNSLDVMLWAWNQAPR